jgi:hypothetical protein
MSALDNKKKQTSSEERTQAIASLRERGISESTIRWLPRLSVAINVAVYALGIAGFFVSDPGHLQVWVLIALPWAAILAVKYFSPFFRFGGPINSSVPDLSLALIIPGLFLSLRVLQAINPVGWEGPLSLTVIGSVLLVGAAIWGDPWLQQHRVTSVLVALLCCGYGYGAGMQVNALLDKSMPQPFQVKVLGKSVGTGRSANYYLVLAPWGPRVAGQKLSVPRSLYEETKLGDSVCMVLRSGALGVAWSEPGSCGAE